MNTPVMVKLPGDVRVLQVDFSDQLIGSETITGQSVAPSIPAGLTVSVAAAVGSAVPLTIGGGADAQSYGVDVTVTTSAAHTYTVRVAVVVSAQAAANYQNVNVDAFQALVGELQAGEAALGKVTFSFPDGFDAVGGSVKWEVVDQNGVVLSSGQAFDYTISTPSVGVKVEAQAVVNVPSDAAPTLTDQAYQLRWTLTVSGQKYWNFETIKIKAPNTVPEGVEDVVEIEGVDVPVSVVYSKAYDQVFLTVYRDNEPLSNPVPAGIPKKTADGWMYTVTLTGLVMDAQLESYTLMWSAKNTDNPYTERQTGRMFIVNPMILSAVDDMRLLIQRSRATITHESDMLFTVPLLLAYLRRGRDAFNGSYGVPTGFTFTRPKGTLREYWLRFSEIAALRSQYLAEGEKAFDYQGQAVSLNVDRTQYYESAASNLQQVLDNECKPFKVMLVKRGIMGGTGEEDPTRQRPGAAGAIGITISPASNFGPYARYRR